MAVTMEARGQVRRSLLRSSQAWHSDKSFRPEPSLATILHALELPPCGGGDTCFANMAAAFDALLDEEKAALEKLRVIHSWG